MRLGDLGRWILRAEVFEYARTDLEGLGPTSIPPDDWGSPTCVPAVGACWVMAVNRNRGPESLLRPCLVLPLQWREQDEHSPLLPRGLTDLAREIFTSLSDEARIAVSRWKLHPGPRSGLDDFDLSEMAMDARSAWAPLSAGLLLATDGIAPDTSVWATGGWDEKQGISEVGGLEDKLRMAAECRARTVFVPSAQLGAATEWKARLGEPVEILGFPGAGGKPSPREALRDYLARLGVRPDPGQAFEVRSRYYGLQTDSEIRRQFYVENLLPELADYYRSLLPRDCRPSHLVTIASDSPELMVLLARAIQAEHCLILYTEDKGKRLNFARNAIERDLLRCKVQARQFTNGDGMRDEINTHVECFLSKVHPSRVLFDLTPGTKEMSILMSFEIAPPGSYLFYARHSTPQRGIVIPEKRPPLIVPPSEPPPAHDDRSPRNPRRYRGGFLPPSHGIGDSGGDD
ncbi:MAG: hypothetical protein ACYC61_03470 [Isosphaeraceae bacterium]